MEIIELITLQTTILAISQFGTFEVILADIPSLYGKLNPTVE